METNRLTTAGLIYVDQLNNCQISFTELFPAIFLYFLFLKETNMQSWLTDSSWNCISLKKKIYLVNQYFMLFFKADTF